MPNNEGSKKLLAGGEEVIKTYENSETDAIYSLTDRRLISVTEDGPRRIKSVSYVSSEVIGVDIVKHTKAPNPLVLVLGGILIAIGVIAGSTMGGSPGILFGGAIGISGIAIFLYELLKDSGKHEIQVLTANADEEELELPVDAESFVDAIHREVGATHPRQ